MLIVIFYAILRNLLFYANGSHEHDFIIMNDNPYYPLNAIQMVVYSTYQQKSCSVILFSLILSFYSMKDLVLLVMITYLSLMIIYYYVNLTRI